MSDVHYSPAWRRRLTGEERALGLACTTALRPGWDPDDAAERIAAVADRRAICLALADARRAGRHGAGAMSARAQASLRKALELRDRERS